MAAPAAATLADGAVSPASATTDSTATPTTADSSSSTASAARAPAGPNLLHADAASKPEAAPLLPSHLCSSYFVEPLSWMAGLVESGALQGKIACPNDKCGAKLGNFDWAGSRESGRALAGDRGMRIGD